MAFTVPKSKRPGLVSSLPKGLIQSYGVPAVATAEYKAGQQAKNKKMATALAALKTAEKKKPAAAKKKAAKK